MSDLIRLKDDPSVSQGLRQMLQDEVDDARAVGAAHMAELGSTIAAGIAVNALPSVGLLSTVTLPTAVALAVVVGSLSGWAGYEVGQSTATQTPAESQVVATAPATQLAATPLSSGEDRSAPAVSETSTAERQRPKPAATPLSTPLPTSMQKTSSARLPQKMTMPKTTMQKTTMQKTSMQRELLLFERGEAALGEHNYEAAQAAFERYVQIHPQGRLRPEAMLGLLRAKMEQGDTDGVHNLLPAFWPTQSPSSKRRWARRVAAFFIKHHRCDWARPLWTAAMGQTPPSSQWTSLIAACAKTDPAGDHLK